MIPCGSRVLTADDGKGNIGAATVNWMIQGSFSPPLIVGGVKADSGAHTDVHGTGRFALNMLSKAQKSCAFDIFKPAKFEDGKISGQTFQTGANGAPVLDAAIAAVECSVRAIVEIDDHHTVVGEVTEAYLPKPIEGWPDAAILEMKDLGDAVVYAD